VALSVACSVRWGPSRPISSRGGVKASKSGRGHREQRHHAQAVQEVGQRAADEAAKVDAQLHDIQSERLPQCQAAQPDGREEGVEVWLAQVAHRLCSEDLELLPHRPHRCCSHSSRDMRIRTSALEGETFVVFSTARALVARCLGFGAPSLLLSTGVLSSVSFLASAARCLSAMAIKLHCGRPPPSLVGNASTRLFAESLLSDGRRGETSTRSADVFLGDSVDANESALMADGEMGNFGDGRTMSFALCDCGSMELAPDSEPSLSELEIMSRRVCASSMSSRMRFSAALPPVRMTWRSLMLLKLHTGDV